MFSFKTKAIISTVTMISVSFALGYFIAWCLFALAALVFGAGTLAALFAGVVLCIAGIVSGLTQKVVGFVLRPLVTLLTFWTASSLVKEAI